MTNDYKKGHDYRMKTDRDYRARHTKKGKKRTTIDPKGKSCYKCGKKLSS